MKKLLALVLALLMLTSVAFAEDTAEMTELDLSEVESLIEEVADYIATALDPEDVVNFTIAMDALPEGYTMETAEVGSTLYATFTKDADSVQFMASITYSELFDGYTLNVDDLSAEELNAEMQEMLGDSYALPEFSFVTTSHGTDVVLVNETGAESDYAEYVTIYQGYMVTVALVKDSELSDADLALGLQLLSDMWFVEK